MLLFIWCAKPLSRVRARAHGGFFGDLVCFLAFYNFAFALEILFVNRLTFCLPLTKFALSAFFGFVCRLLIKALPAAAVVSAAGKQTSINVK